jgi:hypothetical protein
MFWNDTSGNDPTHLYSTRDPWPGVRLIRFANMLWILPFEQALSSLSENIQDFILFL